MKIVLDVQGMKCPMCEKRVNKAVMAVFEGATVTSSYEENKTYVETDMKVTGEEIKAVIEQAGYQVTGYIEQ